MKRLRQTIRAGPQKDGRTGIDIETGSSRVGVAEELADLIHRQVLFSQLGGRVATERMAMDIEAHNLA